MTIVVVGCGRVGAGLARDLQVRGRAVAVVDTDPAAFARLGDHFRGTKVVGSGVDRTALDAAGVSRADALAAVTGDDDVNAVVARAARTELRVPRVVARLYDPAKAAAYDRLGIRTISPVAWGIQRMGDLLTATDVTPVVTLGTGGVDVVECRAPSLLAGRPLSELSVPGEIQPISLTRGGTTILADPGTHLESGDLVQLAVTATSAARLEALLGRPTGGGRP